MSSAPLPAPLNEDLRARLAAVRLVALDVDGVLTDGSVCYEGAREEQRFHVHDGAGIRWLAEAGVRVAWISGRGCPATEHRARELDVRELHLAAGPKDEVLARVQARHGVTSAETLAMGDDWPDLRLALCAGVFCAPADARPEVRRRADWITRARGGRGAVREVAEGILEAKGLFAGRLARYEAR